jgi:signal transduction histidine kinase
MSDPSRLINAVHSITRVLSSTLNLDEGLRLTLQVAMEAVNATGGTIWLHEQEMLVCRHVVGEKAEEMRGFAIHEDQGIAGRVFRTGKPEIDNDAHENPDFYEEVDRQFHHRTRSLVTAPLRYPGGKVVGVVQLINKRDAAFTKDDLNVLDSVASVAAMSLHRADLAKQAERGTLFDFLGRVAHDIKNLDSQISQPLPQLERLLHNALLLLSEEVPREEADRMRAEVSEWLGYVRQGAQRIHRYTNFMADVANGDRPQVFKEQSDLLQVAEQALATLDQKARNTNIRLVREFSPVPTFLFDPFLIERAIVNLVNNAFPHIITDAKTSGTVTVRTRTDGNFAVIEVEDTGTGMFPSVLRSIIEGASTSTTQGGTGLGTKIVKEATEAHGGKFDGVSRIGRGTTFWISLPIPQPDA